MVGQERWRTTVHDLMLNFRETLVALIPYIDRIKIGWRDEEAYDDWDEIAQALYENMVLRSILFSIEHQDDLITAEYGTAYPSYGDRSFFQVRGSTSLGELFVFIGFSTLKYPFDRVKYQAVSESDLRATGAPAHMRFDDAQFLFVANSKSGYREIISDISVEV